MLEKMRNEIEKKNKFNKQFRLNYNNLLKLFK